MDVKSAFLNGYIYEEVYVKQPPGFANLTFPDHVYKLTKALYGLKHAPRAWYERLSSFLLNQGFKRGNIDTTLFIKNSSSGNLITQIYVDDIIFGSPKSALCEDFALSMKGEFEMSMMEELTFFLGLQIKLSPKGIFISQTKYTKELITNFGMENAKSINTQMSLTTVLDEDNNGKRVDETIYRGMIGSLLYLTTSRPDIMFSVCKCARFQSAPKKSHLTVVKRFIRYLIGTSDLGLLYDRSNSFALKGFSYADFAGDKTDRKSTSGACQLLGNALVTWHSKKQNWVALSTTEAEYLAVGSCCTQVLWIMHQLLDYDLSLTSNPIFCDNTSAICLSKNSVHHSREKHIEIKHHFIRDYVAKGVIIASSSVPPISHFRSITSF
ncbi:PREDICTED: uncharacterized protein LOC109235889 [Nicotiana attenuata]|uniref:uncharacterized protein LOC109235889 n=1 Tax=Nicotiana attenuata TaxID=49451 RepID=UPI0009052E5B|nr:PREDICTED: uncharacterized protein LOC109235889 [Nicotiana attenuata]